MTSPNSNGDARARSDDDARLPASSTDGGFGRREVWNELDQSSIMSVEFIAAILVWGGIGLGLDRWLGTRPWLLGIGVLLGFGAGLYLVWLRSSKDMDYPNGAAQARQRSTDQETDGQ